MGKTSKRADVKEVNIKCDVERKGCGYVTGQRSAFIAHVNEKHGLMDDAKRLGERDLEKCTQCGKTVGSRASDEVHVCEGRRNMREIRVQSAKAKEAGDQKKADHMDRKHTVGVDASSSHAAAARAPPGAVRPRSYVSVLNSTGATVVLAGPDGEPVPAARVVASAVQPESMLDDSMDRFPLDMPIFSGDDKYPRMWESIPNGVRDDFIRALRPVANRVRSGPDGVDEERIREFIEWPRLVLRKAGGIGTLRQQLRAATNPEEVVVPTGGAGAGSNSGLTDIEKLAKKVTYRVTSGTRNAVSRAVKLMARDDIDVPDSDVMSGIRALFTESKGAQQQMPADAPIVTVYQGDVVKALKNGVACGASPGPSGWTGEMIQTIMDDETCAAAVVTIINHYLRGDMSERLKLQFKASRVVGIPKPKGGIRTICMGEAMYKLAMSIPVAKVKSEFDAIFDVVQLGIGTAGGSETAIHMVQAALDSKRDSVVVSFDIKNAFNTRRRSDIARALYSERRASLLWRAWRIGYGQVNAALVYSKKGKLLGRLHLEEGVEQGDIMSQFAFDLSMQEVYKRAIVNAGLTQAVAVHDDFTIVGSVAAVRIATEQFLAECEREGIELNARKCRVFGPGAPVGRKTISDEFGFHCIDGDAMELHGAAIGSHSEPMSALVFEGTVRRYSRYFETVRSLSVQVANCVNRVSAACVLNYLNRCLPPIVMRRTNAWFSERMNDVLKQVVGVDASVRLPERVITQASLPIRLGGMHYRDYNEIGAAAYYGAATHAAGRMTGILRELVRLGEASLSRGELVPNYYAYVEAAAQHITNRSAAVANLKPEVTVQLIPHFGEWTRRFGVRKAVAGADGLHIQKSMTAVIETAMRNGLCVTDVDAARLKALEMRGASTFKTLIPVEPFERIDDSDMQIQLRFTLGMRPSDSLVFCGCGRELTSGHAQSCVYIRQHCTTTRHDTVTIAIKSLLEQHGVYTQRELKLPGQERKRPDLTVEHKVLADVIVSTPTCQSYLRAGAATKLGVAARISAQRKVRKYGAVAASENRVFYPLAFESYGGWDEAVFDFFKDMAARVERRVYNGMQSRSHFMSKARRVVAIALVEGNARMVRTALEMAGQPVVRGRLRGGGVRAIE